MNINELPEGSRIELNGVVYDLDADKNWHADDRLDSLTMNEMLSRKGTKIVSVPFEITLKLAEWLDNVYTKMGKPEALIVEASVEAFKTKDDAHISNRPTGVDGAIDIRVKTQNEALAVISQIVNLAKEYGRVDLADVRGLVGLSASFSDTQWGWMPSDTLLITAKKVDDEYELVLPRVKSFKKD